MNSSLTRILCALIVGLLLVLWPDLAANYILIAIGILFLLPGLISLATYYMVKPRQGEQRRRFPIEGLGSVLFGLWLVVMPDFFADVLMFLLGFILMLGGVQQIASLTAARSWAKVSAGFYLVPVLILLAGLLAVFNPTWARNTVFIFIGVSSIVYALSEGINWFRFSRCRPPKQKPGTVSDIEEATIIE